MGVLHFWTITHDIDCKKSPFCIPRGRLGSCCKILDVRSRLQLAAEHISVRESRCEHIGVSPHWHPYGRNARSLPGRSVIAGFPGRRHSRIDQEAQQKFSLSKGNVFEVDIVDISLSGKISFSQDGKEIHLEILFACHLKT